MNERPHVTVVYQDAPTQTGMTCAEAILSAIVLMGIGLVTGWIVWPF